MLSIAGRDGPTDAELIREIEHFCTRLIPELITRFDAHSDASDEEERDELRERLELVEQERDELRDRVSQLEAELSLIS